MPIILPPPLGIDHEELNGSPTEKFGDEGWTAKRSLKIPWDDRLNFVDRMVGRVFASTGAGTIIEKGQPYPYDLPGSEELFAVDCGLKPFDSKVQPKDGTDTSVAEYEFAQADVTYGRFDSDESGGGGGDDGTVIIEEEIEPEAQHLNITVDRIGWAFPGAGGKITKLKPTEVPGTIQISLAWNVTFKFVPSPLPNALVSLLGTINSSAIRSARFGYTFEPYTLLYSTLNLRRSITTDAFGLWTAKTRFVYRPNVTSLAIAAGGNAPGGPGPLGWFGLWRADVATSGGAFGDYDRLVTWNESPGVGVPEKDGDVDLYKQGDFKQLGFSGG